MPANSLSAEGHLRFPEALPDAALQVGRYTLRFARQKDELDAIARLRFEVFNLEMNEGFAHSYETGKDEDPFDRICHHLMITHRDDGVIGTYRLQTNEMVAAGGLGYYSATEYDLSTLPLDVEQQSIELGRACIAKDHRSLKVLYLLWKGIGAYLMHNKKRYLFGCSSLTSQDPIEGHQVYAFFENEGHVHSEIQVLPLEDYQCRLPEGVEVQALKPKVPRLMRVYLSLGAQVCSPPAIDRQFKTIDYFTLFDTAKLNKQAQAYFMPSKT